MSRILFIVTTARTMGDGPQPTGVWLEELAVPYYALKDAGHDVQVATLNGLAIPVDPNSDVPDAKAPDAVRRFRRDPDAVAALAAPADLARLEPERFDAVFVPGGHGVMWDLASSERVATMLGAAWDSGAVVASVCHGPAALVNVSDATGAPLVRGRTVSAFTDSEERGAGLDDTVPFLLESRLRDLGARFSAGEDWAPHAVQDGRLITGQNPASSEAVARKVISALAPG